MTSVYARRGESLKAMAERIRMARHAGRLTQEDLAARIGVSRAHIVNLESGRFDLSLRTLLDLCECLSVGTDWLLGREPFSPREIEIRDLMDENRRLRAVLSRIAGSARMALTEEEEKDET